MSQFFRIFGKAIHFNGVTLICGYYIIDLQLL
jgi:hypothetical protein